MVDHLRKSNTVSTIGLWGRSMGAATSLMHIDRDPSIGNWLEIYKITNDILLFVSWLRNRLCFYKFKIGGGRAL